MRGCGKVLVWLRQAQSPGFGSLASESSACEGGKLERKIFAPALKGEIFLNCKGRKIVYCKLLPQL